MEHLYQWYLHLILIYCLLGFLTTYTDGKPHFNSIPTSTMYMLIGQRVKLTWNYHVDNRSAEFQLYSPTFDLNLPNGTSVQLAYEHKDNRRWNLSSTCPSRLCDRLAIESPSSLVINNVNTNDSGVYACTLRLLEKVPVISRIKLVIIDPPMFTSFPAKQVQQAEGKDLKLLCIAQGSPSPTITWLSVKGKEKKIVIQGIGNAALTIRNIRREQEGTYECQAKNSPIQAPIINQTVVIVTYRPSIVLTLSSPIDVPSWDNNIVNLRCMASGNPIPQIEWSGPDNNGILYGASIVRGGGLLTIQTKHTQDYGQYRCKAVNSRGHDFLHINVNRIVLPGPPVKLTATSHVSTIELTWRRPTLNGGSPILDYKISLNTNPLRTVSVKDQSIILAGLAQNTLYNVTVYARNIVGYGNASSMLITTKKKGSSKPSSDPTVLGVCLAIIFILLIVLVIVGILVYKWWKRQKRKYQYSEDERGKPEADSPKESDVIKLEETVHQNKNNDYRTSHKNHNGSCFQPFMKRPKRRPGQPRQQPRPLEILDPITEENPDEESSEEQCNKNIEEQSELEVITQPEPEQNEKIDSNA